MGENILEPFAGEANRFVEQQRGQGRAPNLLEVLHHLDGWAHSQDLVHELATKKMAVSTYVTALLRSAGPSATV